MANRREVKKKIKSKTNNLIEDAFIESINGDKKESDKMDQLIDSLIDERHDLLSRVSSYPNNGKRSEIRSHFNEVHADLEKKYEEYDKKIGRVG